MKKLIATLVVITFGVSLVSCGSNSLSSLLSGNNGTQGSQTYSYQTAKQYESQLIPYASVLEGMILYKVNQAREKYWSDYENTNHVTVPSEKKAALVLSDELRKASRDHSQNIFDPFLLTDPQQKRYKYPNNKTTSPYTPHWDDTDNTTPSDRIRAAYGIVVNGNVITVNGVQVPKMPVTRYGENIYCVDILELQYHSTLDSFADYFVSGRANDPTTGWMNSQTHRDTLLDVCGDGSIPYTPTFQSCKDPITGKMVTKPYLNFTGVGLAISEYNYNGQLGVWVCATQNFVHKN